MEKHVNKNKLILAWILIATLMVVVGFIGASLFDWFLMAWMPISFLLAVVFQSLSHHFMEEHIVCPKCKGLNELEMLKCVHCGFEFIQECPNCGEFNPHNAQTCRRCGKDMKLDEKDT